MADKRIKDMRINRSKYNFSKQEVGGFIDVHVQDIYSFKNALRFYNDKHGKNLTFTFTEVDELTIQAKVESI